MSTVTPSTPLPALPPSAFPGDWTLADLRRHLGGVPLDRIRLYPPPGMATEEDAFRIHRREDRLYELIDGILVEKAVGVYESVLTSYLGYILHKYLDEHDLGWLAGPDGPFRLFAGRMRMPDISFVSWDRFPDRKLPKTAVLDMGPDLAVEVISKSNTKAEMRQKLDEYFRAGAKLVWYVYPERRCVVAYTSLKESLEVDEEGTLEGGNLLPGFQLKLSELFDHVERE